MWFVLVFCSNRRIYVQSLIWVFRISLLPTLLNSCSHSKSMKREPCVYPVNVVEASRAAEKTQLRAFVVTHPSPIDPQQVWRGLSWLIFDQAIAYIQKICNYPSMTALFSSLFIKNSHCPVKRVQILVRRVIVFNEASIGLPALSPDTAFV